MWLSSVVLLNLYILSLSEAHIPENYYEWAEPTGRESWGIHRRLTSEEGQLRLSAQRSVMAAAGVDAYVIPTADAHNSQYIAPTDARREWVSGFTGSAGAALVTMSEAFISTDSRYFTQFDMEMDTALWTLLRQGMDPSISQWLVVSMAPNSVVGIDPTTYTRSSWASLQSALSAVNVTLLATALNLVDQARTNVGDPAPDRPNNELILHPVEYSGRPASEKINELLDNIRSRGASILILTALDDIAYTLNLRGSDIPYNPVFFSYLIIRADVNSDNIILFWGDGELQQEVTQFLATEGVTLQTRPYSEIFDYIRDLSHDLPFGSVIWLSQDGSEAIHQAAEDNPGVTTLSTLSPVQLMKSIKNQVELDGFRQAHVKDGVALVRFMRWLHESIDAGDVITEMDVSDKLYEFRSEEADFFGESFATIAGAGENGAVIHYKPTREGEERVVRRDDMLLFDSGAQYRDGTTDITRTRHLSTCSDWHRLTFTRVLKGQINMGTAVFPKGSTGNVLDTLARKALWDIGLNYAHGTAHGVGHFLNVHEGPSGIGSAQSSTDPGISPGMIFSNEPGYYEVGEFGIRHEDLVEVIEINRDADHIRAESIEGDFSGAGALGFYTISLAPHQVSCIDVALLNDFEIKYINDYHARVLATLGPILQERGFEEDYNFLEKECAPIYKSSAILLTATPVMAVVTILRMFVL